MVIVGYYEDGSNLIWMAMNGWGAAEPAWWLNMQARPEAVVELARGKRREVVGRAAAGEEPDRLWQRWRELDKDLDGFAGRRPHETAVVVLEARGDRMDSPSEILSKARPGKTAAAFVGARTPAEGIGSSGPQRREPGEESFGVDLEEHLGLAQAGQRTATEAPESDPSRHRARHRGLRLPGDDDLPAMGDRAQARHGVDRQADVPGVGQRRAATVDAGAHPDIDIAGPNLLPQ